MAKRTIANGEMSNRSPDWFVLGCYSIILPRSKIANKNNYVIEIGDKKMGKVGFCTKFICSDNFRWAVWGFSLLCFCHHRLFHRFQRNDYCDYHHLLSLAECVPHFTLNFSLLCKMWIELFLPRYALASVAKPLINHSESNFQSFEQIKHGIIKWQHLIKTF